MPMFRKKPVMVESRRLSVENMRELEGWCGGSIKGVKLTESQRCIDIQTLEGEMRANIGDWIIKGVKGEFYPCRNDIFTMTYDLVEK